MLLLCSLFFRDFFAILSSNVFQMNKKKGDKNKQFDGRNKSKAKSCTIFYFRLLFSLSSLQLKTFFKVHFFLCESNTRTLNSELACEDCLTNIWKFIIHNFPFIFSLFLLNLFRNYLGPHFALTLLMYLTMNMNLIAWNYNSNSKEYHVGINKLVNWEFTRKECKKPPKLSKLTSKIQFPNYKKFSNESELTKPLANICLFDQKTLL